MDLAVLFEEGGDYAQPVLGAIKDAVKAEEAEPLLHANGGVHPVDRMRYGEELITLLKAAACHIAPKSMIREDAAGSQFRSGGLFVRRAALRGREGVAFGGRRGIYGERVHGGNAAGSPLGAHPGKSNVRHLPVRSGAGF